MYSGLPLPEHKILELRGSLQPYEYKVVEEDAKKILVVNTSNVYPDLVNDLENIVEKIDEEDTKDLTHICIIGEREALGVDPKLLEALLIKRRKYDDIVVRRVRKKFDSDFKFLRFEDEDDVYKIGRLAFKIPGKASNYKEYISKFSDVPQNAKIVYWIGDFDYLRMSGGRFYKLFSSQENVIERLKAKLLANNYELVNLEQVNIDLAAQKGSARIVAKYLQNCSLEDADNLNKEAERIRATICLLIVNKISKELKKFALGKKIELFEIDELESLEL